MNNKATDCAVIFTDGACSGNPGPGGYAALIFINGEEQIVTGSDPDTTNNKMELTAAIKALEAPDLAATVYSDSQYVVKGMREWLPSWKKRGWRTAAGGPVKNQSLWETLDRLTSSRTVTWLWVKGHAGHEHNERVDALANAEAQAAAMETGHRLTNKCEARTISFVPAPLVLFDLPISDAMQSRVAKEPIQARERKPVSDCADTNQEQLSMFAPHLWGEHILH